VIFLAVECVPAEKTTMGYGDWFLYCFSDPQNNTFINVYEFVTCSVSI
jgi:hypothetical protein